MSGKEIASCFVSGIADSLTGIHKLYTLDQTQKRVHRELQEIKNNPNSRRKIKTGSKSVSIPSDEEPRLVSRLGQIATLNGAVYFSSVYVARSFVFPLLKNFLHYLNPGFEQIGEFWNSLALLVFNFFWVVPLFLILKFVNTFWCQDISDLAFRYSVGRTRNKPSYSVYFADFIFSVIIQLLFLAQSQVMLHLPLPHPLPLLLHLTHTTLLYSLYSFEYKWLHLGWPLHQRLSYVETNWPYFFGFGLPLSLLVYYPDSIVYSGCVFAVAFPLFIVTANEAEVVSVPVPHLKLFRLSVFLSHLISKLNFVKLFRHLGNVLSWVTMGTRTILRTFSR